MSRKSWKKKWYGRWIEFPGLIRASGMVYTHPREMDLAIETCPSLPQGYVVTLGTDEPPDDRQTLAAEYTTRFPHLRGCPTVVFLGRLHPKKGLDHLIPAFAQIRRQVPNVRLQLVGPGDDEYVARIRSKVVELELTEAVDFIGALEGRLKWGALANADVFVLPSYQENFGIALVEALRIGTPVVCSEFVNLCDDLVAAGAAVRCDLHDVDIAKKVVQLLQFSDEARTIADAGRRYSSEHYTWAKSAEQLMLVYEKVARSEACERIP